MVGNKKDIAVIGAGRFGNAVIRKSVDLKRFVMAIDTSEANLQKVSRIAKTIVMDGSDVDGLKDIGVQKFSTVIVAASDNIEIIASLIEIGVEVDRIIAKANSLGQERVLKKIGVKVIIRPEAEAGIHAAIIATNPSFIRYSKNFQGIGDGYSIGSTIVTNGKFLGKPLRDLGFARYKVSVVSIKRDTKVHIPSGTFVINRNDQVTLIGKNHDMTIIFEELNNAGKVTY